MVAEMAYTVEDIMDILNIKKSSAYNLCKNTKDFSVFKVGRLVRIDKKSFDDWVGKSYTPQDLSVILK